MNETRTYEELRRHLDTLAEDLTGKTDKADIEQKKAKHIRACGCSPRM